MEPLSFTLNPPILLRRLITPAKICIAHVPSPDKPHPPVITVNALWDTGATCTTISNKVAVALGLTPFRFEDVYHAQGVGKAKVYKANIILPNNIEFPVLSVLEGDLHGCDMLIGMDIISQGDFALTNRDGKTVFSFQIPSTHLYDFVKQQTAAQAKSKPKKKR